MGGVPYNECLLFRYRLCKKCRGGCAGVPDSDLNARDQHLLPAEVRARINQGHLFSRTDNPAAGDKKLHTGW